jgi:hypothetical protein
VKWQCDGTVERFGLDVDCTRCFVTPFQLICFDGGAISFGSYDQATSLGAAGGMSRQCTRGIFNLSTVASAPLPFDGLEIDANNNGENITEEDRLYEFQLSCAVVGVLPELDLGDASPTIL